MGTVKEQIANISLEATKEALLEEMMKKVATVWSTLELQLLPYGRQDKDKEKGESGGRDNTYILSLVDDVLTQLEDSQVIISTIKGSRYIGPIRNEVEEWDRQLSLFADTLDAWVNCQRDWMYLESIFSAPDIQRQLPSEYKLFLSVDKSWKGIFTNQI